MKIRIQRPKGVCSVCTRAPIPAWEAPTLPVTRPGGKKPATTDLAPVPVILVRASPSQIELSTRKWWSDEAGMAFRDVFRQVTGHSVSECYTHPLVRCMQVGNRIPVAYVRACAASFETVMHLPWQVIICCGRLVLRHVCMRGATPPEIDVLAGRPVKVPEYPGIPILTIPDPQRLLDADGVPEWNVRSVLAAKLKLMKRGLSPVKELLCRTECLLD